MTNTQLKKIKVANSFISARQKHYLDVKYHPAVLRFKFSTIQKWKLWIQFEINHVCRRSVDPNFCVPHCFDERRDPATQAFMQVVNTPAKNARNTTWDKSVLREGAMAPSPASWIPIELGLAKPQSAEKNCIFIYKTIDFIDLYQQC